MAPGRTPSCEECGYSLVGIDPRDPAGVGACPECGGEFHAHSPWMRRPWPSLARLALRLCGPAAGVAAAFVVLNGLDFTQDWLVLALWPVWLSAVIVFFFALPVNEIRLLCRDCEPEATRACRRGRLRTVVVLVNLLILAAALLIFAALL